MNILWMAWKDAEHPAAGGAEVVKSQICQRLVRDGHNVIQLTAGFKGASPEANIDGCKVVRVGSRYSVYWQARRYYKSHLQGWADLVIDECNTVPFFASIYVCEKNCMVIYQLAREIWFYQMQWPLSTIGYFLEPIYLRILNKNPVLTICASTRNELLKLGFRSEHVKIIRMASEVPPEKNIDAKDMSAPLTLLYFGSLREMKRPHHVVKAFIEAKTRLPELRLILAGGGEGAYLERLKALINSSGYLDSIVFTGRVSGREKIALMKKANLIAVTSVKEGWGLIVTEAAAQGTPAVVYDVDGLRDSVKNEVTGLVTPCSPQDLADGIVRLLKDEVLYGQCRQAAWEWSKELNFENSYNDFCKALNIL